jgi:hypothetical protein
MKKTIVSSLLAFLLSSNAFANCKWSSIKEVDDGFLYSEECHIKVGTLVANEKDYKLLIEEQKKAISLKDLTIKDLTANSNMWEKEAKFQFQTLENYKKAEDKRKWLWIGTGAGATILAIVLAGQISK